MMKVADRLKRTALGLLLGVLGTNPHEAA